MDYLWCDEVGSANPNFSSTDPRFIIRATSLGKEDDE